MAFQAASRNGKRYEAGSHPETLIMENNPDITVLTFSGYCFKKSSFKIFLRYNSPEGLYFHNRMQAQRSLRKRPSSRVCCLKGRINEA
jgi:hypothetical protein